MSSAVFYNKRLSIESNSYLLHSQIGALMASYKYFVIQRGPLGPDSVELLSKHLTQLAASWRLMDIYRSFIVS